jgi:hypothetical protein
VNPFIVDPWTPREKLAALSQSCVAQKTGGLPFLSNPAWRMRQARVFHAPENKKRFSAVKMTRWHLNPH